MTYIVDRIEAGIAVLEALVSGSNATETKEAQKIKEIIEIPKNQLPKGIREGHVLHKEGDAFAIDYKMTKQRREQLKARMKRLFDKHRT